MFRHPRRTRGLHVYQREGRCRILIASHVVAVSVVDRVPRRKVIREYERDQVGQEEIRRKRWNETKPRTRKETGDADGSGASVNSR